jgi:GNAT superfamily N-acetyltransferase
MRHIDIREATVEDSELILRFITELAVYEKAEDQVTATANDIRDSIFGAGSTTHALVCMVDNAPVGYAVYFYNYSTWLGKNGLYLEDLYVSPQYRNCGAGKALLQYLAQIAVSKGCGRFEWCVLDWNAPAIDFYESIGASAQREWVVYRLSGDKLRSFAAGGIA